MKNILLWFCFSVLHLTAFAQAKTGNNKPLLREGNTLYKEQQYEAAAKEYTKALSINNVNPVGYYNNGNALTQLQKYEDARKMFQNAAMYSKDKALKSKALHNIGNTFCAEKKWEEAIDAYKKSLRINPTDAETKYNLAYAQKMLKKDGGGGGKDKDKNKDKDKDKDKKDEKDKDKKDDQQQDEKDKGDKPKEEQDKKGDQNPEHGELSEQQANNILEALQQYEKKIQRDKGKEKGTPVKQDKDW